MCTAHLEFNTTFKKALFIGGLFFLSLLSQAKELHIALLDTSFCPNLIKTHKNIVIGPVVDLTQGHNYKCYKGALKRRAFHGQWVLESLVTEVSPSFKVRISPLIVFNNEGTQKFSYWKRAMQYAQNNEVQLIISAAGLPLLNEELKRKASALKTPNIPMLLAIGRKSPFLREEVPLFPHIHENWEMTYFGSYYAGIDSKDLPTLDKNQFKNHRVNYYFPFENLQFSFNKLKGSSLAVSLGGRFLLQNCLEKLKFINNEVLSKSIKECFSQHSHEITFKNSHSKGRILVK